MKRDPLQDNLDLLRQGIELVAGLDAAVYAGVGDPPGRGIGAHLRHVLDHYAAFLHGVETRFIDYDARIRGGAVESERHEGMRRLVEIAEGLTRVSRDDLDGSVRVREDDSESSGEASSVSSLRRELQFLHSHTVHHWAIVALLLGKRGVEVAEGFGLAPSTRRYLEAQRECVPQAG